MIGAVPDERLLLGIGSGTSADALDLALVRVRGRGGDRRVSACAAAERPLPPELQARIRGEGEWSPGALAGLNAAFGRFAATAAESFLAEFGVAPGRVWAVGSHGQTLFHHDGDPAAGSLQVGEPTLIAARLGVQVVADFRWGDLALGGQGAPISPYADWVLHRKRAPLAILNLGGIANLTWLPGPDRAPRAWDCGPANGPLDALVRQAGGGEYDRDGRLARRGRPIPGLLSELQRDPFFSRSLPRSTGLERFGGGLARRMRTAAPDAPLEDLLATAVELAAWAVADSLERAEWPGGELFLCGGGARNPSLVAALERQVASSGRVGNYRELGWEPDSREAVAFALLADAFLCGEPASWPGTTGARGSALLGKWIPVPRA